jgi:FkbM family methyltransferase
MASVAQLARQVAGRPRLLPLTALLLRARTVRPSLAFLARAAAGRKGAFVYRLRESGLRVTIRHGTGDVVTLGEVFHERDYLPPPALQRQLANTRSVLDLGANVGLFGALAAARWPRAEILAYEPDPDNAAVHEHTIALNGLQGRWRLVRCAVGASSGTAAFVAGDVALSRLADGEEGEGEGEHTIDVQVEDVLAQLGQCDLVKMDIEGGEWAILGDPRFALAPPRALVLEYHPRLCPNGDPRRTAISALEAAGLRVEPVWHRADGHGMLWAWRS